MGTTNRIFVQYGSTVYLGVLLVARVFRLLAVLVGLLPFADGRIGFDGTAGATHNLYGFPVTRKRYGFPATRNLYGFPLTRNLYGSPLRARSHVNIIRRESQHF